MKKEYDFANSIQNPYYTKVKKQISIKIESETIEYFKQLSQKVGMPYQTLINSYLTNCAQNHIEPNMSWS